MTFVPAFPQPFTLQQAIALDVPTITTEISRLQNSLSHLKASQEELHVHIREAEQKGELPDKDFVEAFQENQTVINSQTERIEMLRVALERKGGASASNPHYSLPVSQPAEPPADPGEEDGVFL